MMNAIKAQTDNKDGNKLPIKIGLMCATYNEEANVENLYEQIVQQFKGLGEEFEFELLFIDNASIDKTQDILRSLALDPRVKCIFNQRNFGPVQSAFHGLMQCNGDAIIPICADLQDPPELIPILVKIWQQKNCVVLARRTNSADGLLLNVLKKLYYFSIGNLNKDLRKIRNCTGYGIFGREIHDQLKQTNQQSPFLRGLIAETAGDLEYVDYHRPKRKGGHSSATFFRLWEEGVGGFINNSMIPIRFVTIFGLVACILAVIAAFTFLVLKLIYWESFPIGTIPSLLLQLFFGGANLLFLGIIGEYVGAIFQQNHREQRVFEKERINF